MTKETIEKVEDILYDVRNDVENDLESVYDYGDYNYDVILSFLDGYLEKVYSKLKDEEKESEE